MAGAEQRGARRVGVTKLLARDRPGHTAGAVEPAPEGARMVGGRADALPLRLRWHLGRRGGDLGSHLQSSGTLSRSGRTWKVESVGC